MVKCKLVLDKSVLSKLHGGGEEQNAYSIIFFNPCDHAYVKKFNFVYFGSTALRMSAKNRRWMIQVCLVYRCPCFLPRSETKAPSTLRKRNSWTEVQFSKQIKCFPFIAFLTKQSLVILDSCLRKTVRKAVFSVQTKPKSRRFPSVWRVFKKLHLRDGLTREICSSGVEWRLPNTISY